MGIFDKKNKNIENNIEDINVNNEENSVLALETEEEKVPENKMTLDQYINDRNKYIKNVSKTNYKMILNSLIALLGLMIIYFLVSLVLKVYAINNYAGYACIVLALAFFIAFYLVPVFKFNKLSKFNLEFGTKGLKSAKANNKKICMQIRDRMIDLEDNVSCDMTELEYNFLKNATESDIESALFNSYNNSIKIKAKKIIGKYSRKCAIYTALSQDKTMDALLVATLDYNMIKELTYLYGFRPNDKKMTEIVLHVFRNVLISLGLNDLSAIVGAGFEGIPYVGKLLGKIVESCGQGFVNGVFVNTLGMETIKYLLNDYELQYKLSLIDIIDKDDKDNKLELSNKDMNELNDASKKCSEELKDELKDKCTKIIKKRNKDIKKERFFENEQD